MEAVLATVALVFAVLLVSLWRKARAERSFGPPVGGDAGRGPNDGPDPFQVGDESFGPAHGVSAPGAPIGPGTFVGPGGGGGGGGQGPTSGF